MIGLMVRNNIFYMPKQFLNSEYSFIYLDGKKAVKVGLGTNWRNAWATYTKTYKSKFSGALMYQNGKIYTYSGPRNNWGLYFEALEALGRYFQQNKLNLDPGFEEKESGILSEEQYKKNMLERSKYLDSIQVDFTAAKFHRN